MDQQILSGARTFIDENGGGPGRATAPTVQGVVLDFFGSARVKASMPAERRAGGFVAGGFGN
jgi:hypothetical protein